MAETELDFGQQSQARRTVAIGGTCTDCALSHGGSLMTSAPRASRAAASMMRGEVRLIDAGVAAES
jgi:hypothetical protein